jgi:hypothetical protein
VGQSVICAAASASAEPIVSVPVSDVCCDLLELFAGVSDDRAGQGRNHPVAAVLALAAAVVVVVAGMKGYTAIPPSWPGRRSSCRRGGGCGVAGWCRVGGLDLRWEVSGCWRGWRGAGAGSENPGGPGGVSAAGPGGSVSPSAGAGPGDHDGTPSPRTTPPANPPARSSSAPRPLVEQRIRATAQAGIQPLPGTRTARRLPEHRPGPRTLVFPAALPGGHREPAPVTTGAVAEGSPAPSAARPHGGVRG